MRSSTVGSDDLSFSDAGRGSGLPDGMDRQSDLSAMIDSVKRIPQVLLDDNLMEFTKGRPFPLKHRAKIFFHKAVQNDTLFLSIVNVVDYSILVGFDDKNHELTVGIIDFLRQVSPSNLVCLNCSDDCLLLSMMFYHSTTSSRRWREWERVLWVC